MEGHPWAQMSFKNRTKKSTPGTLYLLEQVVVSKGITAFLHRYPVQVVDMLQKLIVAQVLSTILRVRKGST